MYLAQEEDLLFEEESSTKEPFTGIDACICLSCKIWPLIMLNGTFDVGLQEK